jgi:hydrogenase maturation protease
MCVEFREILRDKKTVLVGIGNVLKKDDGVGVYISHRIEKRMNITPLTVEVSIENYIGKINSLKPDILILVDCMDFNESPGYCKMVPVKSLIGTTTNTHNISLEKVSELFTAKDIYVLGIQPENIQFGQSLSPSVKKSADNLIRKMNAI